MATGDDKARERADLIVRNARVTTLQDGVSAAAEAVAVSGEKIAAVGGEAEVTRLAGASTIVVDAGGRRVIPGLNDSHLHAIRGGLMFNLELRWDGVDNLARGLEMIRGQAERTPEGQWVRVMGGWSPYQFTEKRMPTIAELNRVAPRVPVLVLFGYSQVLVNRAGTAALGLSPASEPPGGQYEFTDGGLSVRGNTAVYATIGGLPTLTDTGDRLNSTQHFLRELLSADYLSVPDDQIPRVESLLTVTGGDVVYAASPFETLSPESLPPVSPVWSPARSQQITTGILSVTTPSVVGWAPAERRQMARRINEYTADLVAQRPDRFGNFATLPLPDIEGALAEAEYALGTLHADGVVLMASYAGKYLGDPAFEPLWAELDRRHTVVFEHPGDRPGQPPLPPAAGVAPPMADFPFETTRTAVQLVLNGVVDRHPGVRVILSHAGGFLPYASLRFAELARVFDPAAAGTDAILTSLRRFYFDTAVSSGAALPTLRTFASPGHILFGTDFPYDHGVSAAFTAALDSADILAAEDQTAISHGNAQALFPRLAA